MLSDYLRELQILYQLRETRNIVKIYDHIVEADPERMRWQVFIRMEYLTGFRDHWAGKVIPEQEQVRMACDICEALACLEKRGIIHRDVKTENIFISEDHIYKLGDFGTARMTEKSVASYSVRGTNSYMAPEIYWGKSYGRTIDCYSLGMVLYRINNGNRDPFIDADRKDVHYSERNEALLRRMRGEKLPPPRYASPAMAKIIRKATSPLPEKRYQSAKDMQRDLLRIQRSSGVEQQRFHMLPGRVIKNPRFMTGVLIAAVLTCGIILWKGVRIRPEAVKRNYVETGSAESAAEMKEDLSQENILQAAGELLTKAKQTAGSDKKSFSMLFSNAEESDIRKWNALFTMLRQYKDEAVVVLAQSDPYALIGFTEYDRVSAKQGKLDSNSQTIIIGFVNGEWKFHFEKQARRELMDIIMNEEGNVYPKALLRALKEGGKEYSDDKNNFMYLNEGCCYEDNFICMVRHIWDDKKGNIGYTVWLANGTSREVVVSDVTVRFTDKKKGLMAEQTVSINRSVPAHANVLIPFETKIDRIDGESGGPEEWSYIFASIEQINVMAVDQENIVDM